jgi:aminopeptidase-like protein
MSATSTRPPIDLDRAGCEMHQLITELYPICRSITGNGVRDTLRALQRHIPLTIHEVPSGTAVFDWTVPKEWNVRDAYIKNAAGERVIDFRQSNLHVMSYSVPVHRTMSLEELKTHLHTLPTYPDWIPYRTSYYQEDWGFCLSHRQLSELPEGTYEVCIDTTLVPGHLTYGEYYLAGASAAEVLISTHVCHPSLCNDNLSGIALATYLGKQLRGETRRYSYRFLFIPGTIGAITWLALHEGDVARIQHGLVLSCVGDAGPLNYKRSRRGDAEIDRAVSHILQYSGQPHEVEEFSPYGYDERQFCSPGFDLPVGRLARTPHGRFPEYHTSADNLDFVRPAALAESLATCLSVLALVEHNRTYLNRNPKCEPQLGRRGLYRLTGGHQDERVDERALLWVLNLSDGRHTLLDIAERSGMPFEGLRRAADLLVAHDLLCEVRVSAASRRDESPSHWSQGVHRVGAGAAAAGGGSRRRRSG